jgi:ferredoxin
MFCPVCRDEYRPGFTRCATCNVALVESLDGDAPEAPQMILAEETPDEPMANFCGFLTLDDARSARETVRGAKLPSEILIRDAPAAAEDAAPREEYWLRVRPKDFRTVDGLLGSERTVPTTSDDAFQCSACSATVHAADLACPGCGMQFEE